ncbi:hypothetical protein [uncultured Sulfitobacter sp.]|uniref:NYN domain-containing protein n=1 Tax=uncultured Sulfitobacter sp. TaxID=191468 RepID=UPI00260CCAE3|nr:hypothetical protein [uncultured Sulfitobacter sp.]
MGSGISVRTLLVDGSNVLYWRGAGPDMETVRLVTDALRMRGHVPLVLFDHSVGRIRGDRALHDALDLRADAVRVMPRGTPADGALLAHADAEGLQIVSRDRFRVWASEVPNLRRNWLVTGRIEKGGRVSLSKKLRRPPV